MEVSFLTFGNNVFSSIKSQKIYRPKYMYEHFVTTGYKVLKIEQKGTTFDRDFGYTFPLFSSLLKKEGRRKGE